MTTIETHVLHHHPRLASLLQAGRIVLGDESRDVTGWPEEHAAAVAIAQAEVDHLCDNAQRYRCAPTPAGWVGIDTIRNSYIVATVIGDKRVPALSPICLTPDGHVRALGAMDNAPMSLATVETQTRPVSAEEARTLALAIRQVAKGYGPESAARIIEDIETADDPYSRVVLAASDSPHREAAREQLVKLSRPLPPLRTGGDEVRLAYYLAASPVTTGE